MTRELFQGGEALYYGRNAISGNLIMADRKRLKNPNGLILGIPGSGKSFAAKREITNAVLITKDDVIVCDPESEYSALVDELRGQVITLSSTGGGRQFVNPMDITPDYSGEDVYCKGRIYRATKKQGKRLICSDLTRFCGEGVVFTGQAA